MSTPSWDDYVDFRARAMHRMASLAGLDLVQDPGVVAVVSSGAGARGGCLLSEPVPSTALDAVLRRGTPQWIAVLPAARPLADVVRDRGWSVHEERVAMALDDLRRLVDVPMPDGVEVQRVAVRQDAEGFPLGEAIRLAYTYGEETTAAERDLEIEAQLLRSLSGIQFFAAVAPDGSCVGTAGSRVVDRSALVASVATDPAVRRRGIGTAMTAAALRAAASAGAVEAFLDATSTAVRIYRRLGFAELGPVLWCERPSGG